MGGPPLSKGCVKSGPWFLILAATIKKGLTDENNWSCEKITSPLMGVGLLRTKAMWSLDSGSRSLSALKLNTKRNKRLLASIKYHSNFDNLFKGLVTSYFSCWNIRYSFQTSSFSPDMTGVSLKNCLRKIPIKFAGGNTLPLMVSGTYSYV